MNSKSVGDEFFLLYDPLAMTRMIMMIEKLLFSFYVFNTHGFMCNPPLSLIFSICLYYSISIIINISFLLPIEGIHNENDLCYGLHYVFIRRIRECLPSSYSLLKKNNGYGKPGEKWEKLSISSTFIPPLPFLCFSLPIYTNSEMEEEECTRSCDDVKKR